MKTRLTTIGLIAPLLAVGCATGPVAPYPDQPDQSFALDQMRAAGFDDINDADISKAKAQQLDDTESSALVAGAFGAANAIAPPAGLSNISAGALGFLSWMAMGDTNPAQESRVIAWVPASLATSPAEAHELMVEEVTDALAVASRETELPNGYRWGEHVHKRVNATKIDRWSIEGPDCGDADSQALCMYQVNFVDWEYAQDDWGETRAPAALGGGAAYRMSEPSNLPSLSPSKILNGGWSAGFPDLALYARMSAELPEWIMLYIAPRRVSYRSDDGDSGLQWKGLGLPILLQGGEAHYFIEPGSPE